MPSRGFSRRARIACYGSAVVVATAVGVVGLATPAFAADLTPSQLKGPVAGTNTITLTGLTLGSGNFPATPVVQFNVAAACPAAPATASGTNVVTVPAGNISGGGTTTLTVVVPGTVSAPVLAATAYNICVYNGTASVAKTATATRYTTVATAAGTLDVSRGPSAGGNSVVLTDTNTNFGTGTTVQFNSAATCPTTYATPAAGTIANATTSVITTPPGTTVTATVPATLTAPTYSVCAYTGTAGTSALLSKVDAGYALTSLTVAPTTGPAAGTNTITATASSGVFSGTPRVEFTTAACPAVYTTPAAGVVAAPVVVLTSATVLTVTVPALPTTPNYVCAYPESGSGNGLLAGTATATYSSVPAGAATLSATSGSSVGGNSLTLTDTSTLFGPGTVVQFNSAGTCPAVIATPAGGTIVNATTNVITTPGTTVTATVPATLTAATYSVCAYTGTAGSSALISGANAGYALVFAITVVPASGPTSGSNVVTVTAPESIFNGTHRVQFSLLPCASTLPTATGGVIVNATVAVLGGLDDELTVTVPALLATSYYVCVYPPVAGGTTLIAATASAAYTAGPAGALTLDTSSGPAGGGTSVVLTDASARFPTGTAVQLRPDACGPTFTTPAGNIVNAATLAPFTAGATSLTITTPALTQTAYYVCAYTGNTNASSALVSGTSTAAFDVIHPLTLNLTTGPDTGGYQITATDAEGGFSGTIGVRFTASACPTTYGAGSGVSTTATVGGLTSLTINVPALTVGPYYVCAYRGNSTNDPLGSETTTAAFTSRNTEPLTLGSANGTTGTNSFTATIPSGTFPSSIAPAWIRFIASVAVCLPSNVVASGTNIAASDVRRISPGNKLAITTAAMAAASYKVCVYADGTTGALLAESAVSYVTAAGVTIDTVSPAAGPAQGGTLITVEGTNFSTAAPGTPGALTVTIGGVPLTEVTVGGGGTSFTALTPAHAPGGPFDLAVSSPSGSATKAGAFTYSYGIRVTPSAAPNTESVDISVSGVGFTGVDFDTDGAATGTTGDTPSGVGGHVYLVKGEYDPTELHTATFKVNDMLLECVDVLVIDDTELVCALHLNGVGGVAGQPTLTLRPAWHAPTAGTPATDATVAAGSNTLVSVTAGMFTAADIGLTVVNAALPAGTTIVQVVNGTTAILSQRATAAISGGQVDYLAPRAETVTALAIGSTITDASFAGGADVGRQVSGVGIQPGTVITSISGNDATLSKPIVTAGALSILVGEPAVPKGAYTITVVSNGAVDADRDDPAYAQSIITSTSTFTVADY